MRHTAIALALLLCPPMAAQSAKIDVGSLKRLSDAASECVEVSLDGMALRWALGALKDEDEPEAYNLVKGIKGIYVHAFEFDEDGKFSAEDTEKIRRQIKTPPWERIVSARSKKDGEEADVFFLIDPKTEKFKGLAVLAVEKRAIAIVNIVGSISLEGLSRMEGHFGIPELDLGEGGGDD
jgi:hypothetical protein